MIAARAYDPPYYPPTIRVRSPYLSPLRSPYDQTTIPPTFFPLIPPADRSPALGLGGPAQLRPKQERGGLERHRHACMRVDIEQRVFCTIARGCLPSLAARVSQRGFVLARRPTPPSSRTNPRPPHGLCSRSPFPCASRSPIKWDHSPHNLLCCNETHRRRHLSADQKDIYARALSRPLALWEASSRARGPGDEPPAKRRSGDALHGNDRAKDPRHMPVPHLFPTRRYIDLSIQHIAALSKILDGFGSEKLVPPKSRAFENLAAAGFQNPRRP
jgi:hypothetical protein